MPCPCLLLYLLEYFGADTVGADTVELCSISLPFTIYGIARFGGPLHAQWKLYGPVHIVTLVVWPPWNTGLLHVFSVIGISLSWVAFLHCPIVTLFLPCHCSNCVMLVGLTSSCHELLPHPLPLAYATLPCLCHATCCPWEFPKPLGYFVLPGILYRHGHARTMFSLVRSAWVLSLTRSITGPGTIFIIWVRLCDVLDCMSLAYAEILKGVSKSKTYTA